MHYLQPTLQELPIGFRLDQPMQHLLASAWAGIIRVQRNVPGGNQPRILRRRPTDVWDFLGESFLAWIGLCLALLILAGVVYWLRSWWREDAGRAVDSNELLSQFRELHREGDLTEEEFRSIKSRLTAPAPPEQPPEQQAEGRAERSGNADDEETAHRPA